MGQSIGCDNCVTACENAHPDGLNRFRWSAMREIPGSTPQVRLSNSCKQCEVPLCIEACPVNCIEVERSAGAVRINYDLCVCCRACADPTRGCPYGSIEIVSFTEVQPLPKPLELPILGTLARLLGKPAYTPPVKARKSGGYPVKCDLCCDHVVEACVEHCPTGAVFRLDLTEVKPSGTAVTTCVKTPGKIGFDLECWAPRNPQAGTKPSIRLCVAGDGSGLRITSEGAGADLASGERRVSRSRFWTYAPEDGTEILTLNFYLRAVPDLHVALVGDAPPLRQLDVPCEGPLHGSVSFPVTCGSEGAKEAEVFVYHGGLYLGVLPVSFTVVPSQREREAGHRSKEEGNGPH